MSQAWPVSTATITDFPGGTADVADGSFPEVGLRNREVRFTPQEPTSSAQPTPVCLDAVVLSQG